MKSFFVTDPLNANYMLFASSVISVPVLILFTTKENRRLDLDTHTHHVNSLFQSTASSGSLHSTSKEKI